LGYRELTIAPVRRLSMLVSRKSNIGSVVLVCCFILLCSGIREAQAQSFSTAISHILNSNTVYNTAAFNTSYALYSRSPSYLYNAYNNMFNAYNHAYNGYYYGASGYSSHGTTTGYYCYVYAYNDYIYKYNAYTYLYNTYVSGNYNNYASSIISNSYYGDYYNGYAAYYCGLSSNGGAR
jgi:hypothetical protein